MTSKEAANILVARRILKDLDDLKRMGGPFSSFQEVDKYLRTRSKKKEERFYSEVRYARGTSLTMPKTSNLFRLMRDLKKLPIATYATNLKFFLDTASSKSDVSLIDLNSFGQN